MFSLETSIFRLPVDLGVLIRSAEGRILNQEVPPPPWSSPGAPLLPLNLRLISDRWLMKKWFLSSVWSPNLFTGLETLSGKRSTEKRRTVSK